MSITVNPEPEAMGRIRAYADEAGTGIEDAVTHFLNMVFGGEPDDQSDLEAVREGIADADAGRTISMEEYAASVEARYGHTRRRGQDTV